MSICLYMTDITCSAPYRFLVQRFRDVESSFLCQELFGMEIGCLRWARSANCMKRGQHITPELTRVKINRRVPLEIRWTIPVKIHWGTIGNPLSNVTDKWQLARKCHWKSIGKCHHWKSTTISEVSIPGEQCCLSLEAREWRKLLPPEGRILTYFSCWNKQQSRELVNCCGSWCQCWNKQPGSLRHVADYYFSVEINNQGACDMLRIIISALT